MKRSRLLKQLYDDVPRYCDPATGVLASDDEHHWRISALAAARKWADANSATFGWERSDEMSDGAHPYPLWCCHVVIGGRLVASSDEVDFGPGTEPDSGNALWTEADAALRAMTNVIWADDKVDADQTGWFR